MKKFFILSLFGVLLSLSSFAVSAITGPSAICVGNTATMMDSTAGGTWTSSNTAIATVGSTTGVVSGVAAGIATISYITGTGTATTVITVNAPPAAITGSSTVCVGSSIALSDATSGGTWISGNTSLATVGATTGVVTGVAAGVLNIYYSVGGCGTYKTVTVNAAPATIGGSGAVCVGSTATLTDATAGGTWSSANPAVATVGSLTGVVTGVTAGTSTIYYMAGGCATYKVVTVTASPAAISGSSTVCVGSSVTFTDATSGGTWASSVSTVATVGSTTGIVMGVATGTSVIYYSVPGCGGAYKIVTVTAAPAAITGSSTVCVGGSITLSDATSGGSWFSTPTSIATVGTTSGVVTGVAAGVATISYYISGCGMVTTTVTVNAGAGTITGGSTLCAGSTTTLSSTVSGGTWSSSNTAVATVGSTTGIVNGVAAGTATIYYMAGGCATYKVVTVTASPAAISGSSTVCVGSTITLTDATAGGTWASSATGVATVGSGTGVVTGVATGTSVIYYSVPGCGGAYKIVTVTAAPAAITGGSSVCVGSTITLADATSGGTWSSSATSIAYVSASLGIVYGSSPGVATISYTISGCGSVTKSVTVNPGAGSITGSSTMCVGSTITLADTTSGGSWSSSNTAVATVGSSSGIVTGVAAGTATIYYVVGSCATYKIVTVTAAPAAISGSSTVCVGSTITLTDATSGGTWASSVSTVATVGSATGVVTGVTAGTSVIYYSVPGCGGAYKIVTVNAPPAAIAGGSAVCVGHTLSLSDATAGGTWISGNTSFATVGSATGIVTGVAPGVLNIYYSVGGCGTYHTVTVNAVPTITSTISSVCIGSSITLSASVGGGTWSSTSTHVSVGSATGVVTGVSAGTAAVYYLVGGCGAYKIVTVSACTGSIGGGITTGGPKGTSSGVPVVGMLVRLKYASTSAILTQTYTDASGMYSFSGLADDDYYVYPEEAGYTTTPSATLTISGASAIYNNIDFKVHDGSRTIVPVTTGVYQVQNGGSVNVYPNPAQGSLYVGWSGQRMDGASVILTDVTGREVSRTVINNSNATGEAQVNVSGLAAGIYLIHVRSGDVNYRTEILIR